MTGASTSIYALDQTANIGYAGMFPLVFTPEEDMLSRSCSLRDNVWGT